MVFCPATIGTDVFEVQQPLDTMIFQWFPMVANHWSNDGMVTIHRYGPLRCFVYLHFLECVQKVFGPDIMVVRILLN